MPKKTKKEKIIAEYRRKMASFSHGDNLNTSSPALEKTEEKPLKQTFSYVSTAPRIAQTHGKSTPALDPKEFLAIKKDLLWTLILTTGIIIGEIGLWKVLG